MPEPHLHDEQLVAITFDDGSVGIMSLILDPRLPMGTVRYGWDEKTGERTPTDQAINAEIARSSFDRQPIGWRRLNSRAEVPSDRTYRDAWTDSMRQGIIHDMGKARALHLGFLRVERAGVMEQLDRDFTRALGQKRPTEADAIEAKRQALRDMPVTLGPAIEAAQTVNDLKLIRLPA